MIASQENPFNLFKRFWNQSYDVQEQDTLKRFSPLACIKSFSDNSYKI